MEIKDQSAAEDNKHKAVWIEWNRYNYNNTSTEAPLLPKP